MVDVKTTSRHEIVEGQQFIVNDVGKSAQEDKNDCERNERTKRDAPAEAEVLIMLKKMWDRHATLMCNSISHEDQTRPGRPVDLNNPHFCPTITRQPSAVSRRSGSAGLANY